MGKLFLLFTAIPLIELYLLVSIGKVIGPAWTIGLVVITGAVGAWFARMEGMRVVRRSREALARNELPTEGVIDGMLIFVGGILLVTPGVLTDVAGLALVLPFTRRLFHAPLYKALKQQIDQGVIQVVAASGRPGPPGSVIDVEGEVIDVTDVVEPPPRALDD